MARPAHTPVINPPRWPKLSTFVSAFGPIFKFINSNTPTNEIRNTL